MVGSLLKKANLSTSHRPTTCAAIFFICWRCLPLAPWNRESESSGSQPVYRKLFSHGPHSSKNNFFGIKISRPTPWVSLSVLLWLLVIAIHWWHVYNLKMAGKRQQYRWRHWSRRTWYGTKTSVSSDMPFGGPSVDCRKRCENARMKNAVINMFLLTRKQRVIACGLKNS